MLWKNSTTSWETMTDVQRLCCHAYAKMRDYGARWERVSATRGWPTPAEGEARLAKAKARFDLASRVYHLLDEARAIEARAGLRARPA